MCPFPAAACDTLHGFLRNCSLSRRQGKSQQHRYSARFPLWDNTRPLQIIPHEVIIAVPFMDRRRESIRATAFWSDSVTQTNMASMGIAATGQNGSATALFHLGSQSVR